MHTADFPRHELKGGATPYEIVSCIQAQLDQYERGRMPRCSALNEPTVVLGDHNVLAEATL
jgi:hypothetical protein